MTKREFGFLITGIGLGSYVPKMIPKTKIAKSVKYFTEVLTAQKRLNRILVTEYEKIDEAIESEIAYLSMINPNISLTNWKINFEVRDNDGHRVIHLNMDRGKNNV